MIDSNIISPMNQVTILTMGQIEAMINSAAEMAVEKYINSTQQYCADNKDEEFLSREEAAKILHVDLSTLNRWAKDGCLVPQKAGKRRVLYRRSEVFDYINMKGKHNKEGLSVQATEHKAEEAGA